jgi:hypothetical protein
MSLDTIAIDIMGAIQTLINDNIAGVIAPQPGVYPTAIDTANGQAVALTFLADGQSWQKGAGYSQGEYTYEVIVFLDPVAQSDIPIHTVDGATLVQKFHNVFDLSTNTPLFNPGAYQATIESGPTGPHISHTRPGPNLTFRGVAWYGFILSVPVRWQGPQV